MNTKYIWDKWELIAINYLQKHKYIIKDINFRFGRFWEVDIICIKDWINIFIEVKYRKDIKYWYPEEAVTKHKLNKYIKTIDYYSIKNKIDFSKRQFDVIAILKGENKYIIKHYKNISLE